MDGVVAAQFGPVAPPVAIASPTCGVEDLCLGYGGLRQSRRMLALGDGWTRRWTAGRWSSRGAARRGTATTPCVSREIMKVRGDGGLSGEGLRRGLGKKARVFGPTEKLAEGSHDLMYTHAGTTAAKYLTESPEICAM